MTPQTVHRIAQEIRHFRELLTADEKFLQRQEPTSLREEGFRRINFWRRSLKDAEYQLSRQDGTSISGPNRLPQQSAAAAVFRQAPSV